MICSDVNNNSIKISAILPNYNSIEYLSKSIQSLVDQTEPFSEIIIVDDGSTDASLSLINRFIQKYPHIRLIKHKKNQGVTPALNTGLQHATGDYIIMCAADDWYHKNMVALAKKTIQQFPEIGFVCGDALVQHYVKKSSFKRMLPYPVKKEITSSEFKSIARKHYVAFNGGGSMFINRQAIEKAGKLFPQLRWHSDWMLYMVVAFEYGFYYLNEIFVYIDMREAAYSEGKKDWKIQKQVMIDTVNLVSNRYPELWRDFKESALLPHYTYKYILLFFTKQNLRRFLTVHLLWKFLINNSMVVRIGRLFPYRAILHIKKLLKA